MIYLVDLESVETRYTSEWKTALPRFLSEGLNEELTVITGPDGQQETTPGAFLNFADTNIYKSVQAQKIAELFRDGIVKNGDFFLFTDAWNPTILQLRYMSDLLDIHVRAGGLWHAGSYDPEDFLGRKIGQHPWVRHTELGMFFAYDYNFFATEFHREMFIHGFKHIYDNAESLITPHTHVIGWPMDYLRDRIQPGKKDDLILFPHRMAPEKQPEIFEKLRNLLPEYEFVFAQEQSLTKDEYHALLSRTKIVFSANLQETLGISPYEGMLAGAVPMLPNRLSYAEMYDSHFLYPSDWTEDLINFDLNKYKLVGWIKDTINNYEYLSDRVAKEVTIVGDDFFSGNELLKYME